MAILAIMGKIRLLGAGYSKGGAAPTTLVLGSNLEPSDGEFSDQ